MLFSAQTLSRVVLVAGGLATGALTGCASAGHGPRDAVPLGAPAMVRPQQPPTLSRYDTARAVGAQGASQGAGTGATMTVSLGDGDVAVPLAPSERPSITLPDESGAARAPRARGEAKTGEAKTGEAKTGKAKTGKAPVTARPVRNPSYRARTPDPVRAVTAVYRPLGVAELSRKVEMDARFQGSSADLADDLDARLNQAAAVLRVNPTVAIRVSGYALQSEVGGRALALRRAETVAAALRTRGVGGARINTEGLLVLGAARRDVSAEALVRAGRRAHVRITQGTPEQDPFAPGEVPGLR